MAGKARSTGPAVAVPPALIAVLVVALVSGCGSGNEQADPSSPEAFQQRVDQAIAGAQKDSDVSQDQVDALKAIKEAGSVSFETARERVSAAIDCMAESGVSAQYSEREKAGSLLVPIYLAQIDPDSPVTDGITQDERIVEACDNRELYWINKLYLTQPTSVQASEAEIEKRAPEIRACLTDAGYPPPADATPTELDRLAMDQLGRSEGEIDCVIGSGL